MRMEKELVQILYKLRRTKSVTVNRDNFESLKENCL